MENRFFVIKFYDADTTKPNNVVVVFLLFFCSVFIPDTVSVSFRLFFLHTTYILIQYSGKLNGRLLRNRHCSTLKNKNNHQSVREMAGKRKESDSGSKVNDRE